MKTHTGIFSCWWRVMSVSFTLVELLVVISIIAILTSILLPALNKARDTTKRIACASNEKQLGIALGMYTNDYNGYYPFFWHPSAAVPRLGYWPDRFIENGYLPKGRDKGSHLGCEMDISLHCPERLPEISGYKADYCIQSVAAWGGGGFQAAVDDANPGCKTTNILKSAKLVAFGESWISSPEGQSDARNTAFLDWTQWPGAAVVIKSLLPWRHQLGSNYVFCDGHVEFINAREINFSYFNINQINKTVRPDLSMIGIAE